MSNSEVLLALITELRALQQKVAELASKELDRRAASGTPIYPSLTAGRVLFAGASKELDDDSNLVWDDTNKRIGVGTASPDATVDIRAAAASAAAEVGALRIAEASVPAKRTYWGWDGTLGGGSGAGYWQTVYNGVAPYPSVINPNGGNVGVGATNPNRKLTINTTGAETYIGFQRDGSERFVIGSEPGASRHFVFYHNTIGYVGNIESGSGYWRIGDGTLATYRLELPNTASAAGQGRANAWVTYSSKTFKKGIKHPDRASHKRKVKRLRTVEYEVDLPAEDGKPAQTATDISLIAEEVREVWPELVTGDPARPETLGLKLDRIGVVLLPEVQEHDERLDALEGEITRLKQEVAEGQRAIARQQELLDALTRRIEVIEKKK